MKKLLISILLGLAWGIPSLVRAGGPITQVQSMHGSTTIYGTAWVQVVSSLSKTANYVDVHNSSASGTLILGIGASGSEYNALYIVPSTDRTIPLRVPKGSRVSLKGLSPNGLYSITNGETILTFLE